MQEKNIISMALFHEGIKYIYTHFEPIGYKLLKSNVIKKKENNFIYEISFQSNRYNFIDNLEKRGSVSWIIYCHIKLNKKVVYSFNFTEPRQLTPFIEILDEKLRIKYSLLDSLIVKIDQYFLEVVHKLKFNPEEFLRNEIKLMPSGQPDDYSFRWTLDRQLVQFYGDEDMLRIYDNNLREQRKLCETVSRNIQEYYIFVKSKKLLNEGWCISKGNRYFYNIAKEIYFYKKKKNSLTKNTEEYFNIILDYQENDLLKLAVITYLFCMDSIKRSQIEKGNLNNEVQQICKNILM